MQLLQLKPEAPTSISAKEKTPTPKCETKKVCTRKIQTPREARKEGTDREKIVLDNVSDLVDQETESETGTGKHF